MDISCISGILQ